MQSKNSLPFQKLDSWYGVNSKDSNENMLDGELEEHSRNVYSDPRGGLGSRSGYTSIVDSYLSPDNVDLGNTVAVCGFYQFSKSSTDYFIGGTSTGTIFKAASNTFEQLCLSGTLISGVDIRYSFAQLNNICTIVCGGMNPRKYTGTGSIATLGGTLVTADFCLEWQSYMWMHSTADKNLMYYCEDVNDPESGYTSFLNFYRTKGDVVGAARQGDDMVVFKNWSLERIQYTGSEPKFQTYILDAKVGTVSHWTIKETQDGRLIFLGPDQQVYMLVGDNAFPVGDNIRKILKSSVQTRLEYAIAGLNRNRDQYHLSITYNSNSSVHDMNLVMDYSRPYQDKWGKLQYPWFVFEYNDAANCFAEIYLSGKAWLYHGGYLGRMYKDDFGTNDNGIAFRNVAISKRFSEGDVTVEKKYSKLFLSYENKGTHNLDISFLIDDNALTQKVIQQSMLGGGGDNSLWDVAKWDEDNWSGETDIDVGRDIDRVGKGIQVSMGTDGLDESWNVYNYTILAKPLRRGTVRSRSVS